MRRIVYCGLAALATGLQSERAMSAAWTASSTLSADAQYVDNPRLSSDGSEAISSGVLDASGSVAMEAERSAFQLSPRARLTRFPNDDELSRNEYFVNFRGSRIAARGSLGLDASVTRDTSLTTEWGGDLFTQERKWRRSRTLNPSWTAELSEVRVLRLGYGYTDSIYEDAEFTPLTGYRYRWADGAMTRQLGEQTSVTWSAYASRYETTRFGTEVDDGGGRLAFSRELSARMRTEFSVGGHRTHTTSLGDESWKSGALLDARVSGATLRGTWTAALMRKVEPSGFGTLLQVDSLTASASRALSAEWTTACTARVTQTDAVRSQPTDADRKIVSVDGNFIWKGGGDWSVAAGFTLARYEYERADTSANSRTVFLRVVFRTDERQL